ncbi:MAG: DUF3137 domain-containing protein [Candidatus Izemoplasmataceae bacterium]
MRSVDLADMDALNRKKHVSEAVVIFGVAVFLIVYLLVGGEAIWYALLGIAISVGGIIHYAYVINRFKKKFLKAHLESRIEECTYSPSEGLTLDEVMDCGFLKAPDRIKTEDYLSGVIQDVWFKTSDVKLQEKEVYYEDGKRRTRWETYFNGRVFKFDFNKTFKGKLYVLERFKPLTNDRFEKVEMESVDFNKTFKTYSTESLTAYYILTPHLMESIMKIEKNHPGNLGLSFDGTELNVAIKTHRTSFRVFPFQSLNKELLEKFDEDLDMIFDIVKELKLNRKVFQSA